MKMKQRMKIIAVVLSLLMAIQVIPFQALAETIADSSATGQGAVLKDVSVLQKEPEEMNLQDLTSEDIVGEIIEKREENAKHFRLANGQNVAVVYQDAVHELVDGQWTEIDNSLETVSSPNTMQARSINGKNVPVEEEKLSNKSHNFKVSFAKEENSNQLLSIHQGDASISWKLENANQKEFEVKNLENNIPEGRKNTLFAVKNNASAGIYRDIVPGTDIEYILKGTSVKENIIVKDKSGIKDYIFTIQCSNVTATLNEDQSVTFFAADGSEVYTVAAPFMFDAKDEYNNQVKVELTASDTGYIYKLIPDKEWMQSEDRQFPITIDPTVNSEQSTRTSYSTYIKESMPDIPFKNETSFRVGEATNTVNNPATQYGLAKFDLPNLGSGNYVVGAYLKLTPVYDETGYSWQNSKLGRHTIGVYKVTSEWDDKVTWNNPPSIDPSVIDYRWATLTNWDYQFNITEAAKEWYDTGVNNGVEFRLSNESPDGFYCAFASDSQWGPDPNAFPVLTIQYMNTTGLEDYYSYQSASAGNAGTAYVQSNSGNLVFTHNDVGVDGELMPVQINHIYNANNRYDVGYGNGWKINYDQHLGEATLGGKPYYLYYDGDGTIHYFEKVSGASEYSDESGLNLKLTVPAIGDCYYLIKDKDDNRLEFNSAKILNKMCNAQGKAISITRNGNNQITGISDGGGRNYTFTYSGSHLDTITAPDGRICKFIYSVNDLAGIEDQKNSSGRLSYTGFNYDYGLSKARWEGNNGIAYDSVTMSYNAGGNVTALQEWNRTQLLSSSTFEYAPRQTVVTDHKGRKVTYQFNEFGNTKCIYNSEGQAQYFKYYAPSDTNPSGNGKTYGANKMELSSNMTKVSANLLQNGSFEMDNSGWSYGSANSGRTMLVNYDGPSCCYMDNGTSSGTIVSTQSVQLERGKTYTFSAYVYNTGSGTAKIYSQYQRTSGVNTFSNIATLSNNGGWQRISATITVASDSFTDWVTLVLNKTGAGAAYFDCAQLEESGTANRYNLIENPDMKYTSGALPNGWSSNNTSEDGMTGAEAEQTSFGLNRNAFQMVGRTNQLKVLNTSVSTSGKSGTVLNYGGWMKADSIPEVSLQIFDSMCRMSIYLFNGDNCFQAQEVRANRFNEDWQFLGDTIIANGDFNRVELRFEYLNNVNMAYCDGAFIYKEFFGQSYRYDKDGNVISTTAYDKQQSTFEYNQNSDMVKSIAPNGSSYTYNYGPTHLLNDAKSAEGVDYGFFYDSNGNISQAQTTTGSTINTSSASYTDNGQYLSSMSDVRGNSASYQYNGDGTVNTATDQSGTQTNYTYDNYGRTTKVSAVNTNGATVSTDYTYTPSDQLSSIKHNGVYYSFTYDACGRILYTSVDNGSSGQRLTTNNYVSPDGGVNSNLISSVVYGNGNKKAYEYDTQDRLTGEKYDSDTSNRFTYKYDSEGKLCYQQDTVNGTEVYYQYDLSQRLCEIKTVSAGLEYILRYNYDVNNNLTEIKEITGGNESNAKYLYNKDNLTTQVKTQAGSKLNYDYSYDKRINLHDPSKFVGNNASYGFSSNGAKFTMINSHMFSPVKTEQTVLIEKTSAAQYATNWGAIRTNEPKRDERYRISFWYYAEPGAGGNLSTYFGGVDSSGGWILQSSKNTDAVVTGQWIYYEKVVTMYSALYQAANFVTPVIDWPESTTGKMYINAVHVTKETEDVWTNQGLSGSTTNNGGTVTVNPAGSGAPNPYSTTVQWTKTGSKSQWHGTHGTITTDIPKPNETWEISFWAKSTVSANLNFEFGGGSNQWSAQSTTANITVNSSNWIKYSALVTLNGEIYNELNTLYPNLYWNYNTISGSVYINGVTVKRVGNTSDAAQRHYGFYSVTETGTVTSSTDTSAPIAYKPITVMKNLSSSSVFTSYNGNGFTKILNIGEQWTLAFWAKGELGSVSGATISMKFQSRGNTSSTLDDININIPADSKWHYYKYSFTAPNISSSSKPYFTASIGNQASLQINAVQLTPGRYAPSDETYTDDGKLKNITIDTGAYLYNTGIEYDVSSSRSELNRIKNYINDGLATGYSYDNKGNITDIYLPDGKEIHYQYDKLNQLIREDNQTLADSGNPVFSNGKSILYTYDASGNLTYKDSFGYTRNALSGKGSIRDTYIYNSTQWKDKILAYNGKYVITDAIGNPTSYDGWSFGWEGGRQLKSLSKTGTSLSFLYNSDGIRTKKTVNGVATNYNVTDGAIRSLTKGSITVKFSYNGDSVVSMTYNGTEYWYIRNAQNDIIGLIDRTGAMVVQYAYDTWGKLLSITGSLASTVGTINPFRYRGYVYDDESGLYYLQSRYYNPEWCRFINADGQLNQNTGFSGLNLFTYCNNNPVMLTDSDGHMPFFAITALIGAVAGAVIGAVTTRSWQGALKGAAIGGLIGLGLGAAAGVMLAGSATASTAAVVAGGKALAATIGGGGLAAGGKMIVDNVSRIGQKIGGKVAQAATSNSSSVAPKTIKIISKVNNDVINLERTGSALKTDLHHAFSNIVDNYAGLATKSPINNATLYQLQGSLNGVVGRFEWIVQNNQVTHRMFINGGGINGIPIIP